jgi:3-methyladenine DNA glycosylase AlkD
MEYLISTKSWWDTVDMLAAKNLGEILHSNLDIMESKIHEYTEDENMWINRSAIISQLGFKSDTNIDLLEFSILPHLNSKEFFLQKAIGWALRQYAKTNPNWVIEFVNKYTLKPLSKREALKHLR